jgi:hypothetical protein
MNEQLIITIFTSIIGRPPEESSLNFWKNYVGQSPERIGDFIKFLINSPEAIDSFIPNDPVYALKKIYEKIDLGMSAGNPLLINELPKKFYFMHIPKTAGISVSFGISNLFHPLQIVSNTFGNILNKDTTHKKLYLGHYGADQIDLNHPTKIAISTIRDPKVRIKSFYNFLKHVPFDTPTWGLVSEAASKNSFYNFLKITDPNIRFSFDNYYTRAFSGIGLPNIRLDDPLDQSTIKVAILNLNKFDLIINVDLLNNKLYYESILERIRKLFGDYIDIPKLNQSKEVNYLNDTDVPYELIEKDIILMKDFLKNDFK